MHYIKIAEKHDARGLYLLMTNGTVKCLPGNIYLVDREQIQLLKKHGIPFRKLTLDKVLETQMNRWKSTRFTCP